MNLNHRLVDGKNDSPLTVAIRKFGPPLKIILPVFIIILTAISLLSISGTTGNTGTFSLVFLPIIGAKLAPFLQGENNEFMTALIKLGYGLGPVSFYFFVYGISRRHLPALVAGLMTILPIIPVSGSVPERLSLALVDLDGGHILGLTIIPWISLLFLRFARLGERKIQLGVVGLSFVLGLISFFAFCICLVFLLYITISEALVSTGRIKFRRFASTAGIQIFILVLVNIAVLMYG